MAILIDLQKSSKMVGQNVAVKHLHDYSRYLISRQTVVIPRVVH